MRSSSQPTLDILIHCPGSHGVVPDQLHMQATALHELGIRILLLCSPGFLRTRNPAYPVDSCLAEGASNHTAGSISRKWIKHVQTIRNQLRLAAEIYRLQPSIVLSASHIEKDSPFWVWPLVFFARFRNVVFATNLHFSQPDKTETSKWWRSVCYKFSFYPTSIAIAHKRLSNPNVIPDNVRLVEVPLGPDSKENINENAKSIRKGWKVPRGKKVFLAFGAIRNHKNLDLAIWALVDNPDAFLVVLGGISSHKDKPIKHYQRLAEDLGLARRVYISDEFVAEEKRRSYFEAADFILLTYTASYHSQTSSLNSAVEANRRVLASSGTSPMRDMVEHFGLGVYVDPDSRHAVADGMATLLAGDLPEPNWEGYLNHATWENNVIRLLEAASDHLNGRPTPQRQFEGLEDEAAPLPKVISAKSQIDETAEASKKSKAFVAKKSAGAQAPLQRESPVATLTPKHLVKGKNPQELTTKVPATSVAVPLASKAVEPKIEKISKRKPKQQTEFPVDLGLIASKPDDIKRRRAIRRKRKKRLLVE